MNHLLCQVCGFANEDNRVFCQNCGARLPVPEGEGKTQAAPSQSKPPLPQFAPQRVFPRHSSSVPKKGFHFLASAASVTTSSAILGILLAILLQILRPPDDLPPRVLRPSEPFASSLATSLHLASEDLYPRTVEVSTDQANNFLAARVRPKNNSAAIKFRRSYTVPTHDSTRIGIEQSLFRLSIYHELVIQPLPTGDKMHARFIAGSIGRMPIPEPLVPTYAKFFEPFFDSLGGVIAWLSSASAIQSSSQGWTIRWPGAHSNR